MNSQSSLFINVCIAELEVIILNQYQSLYKVKGLVCITSKNNLGAIREDWCGRFRHFIVRGASVRHWHRQDLQPELHFHSWHIPHTVTKHKTGIYAATSMSEGRGRSDSSGALAAGLRGLKLFVVQVLAVQLLVVVLAHPADALVPGKIARVHCLACAPRTHSAR